MKVTSSELPGVLIIEPDVLRDNRGFFLETYNHNSYRAAGLADVFVQDNHSCSRYATLRGMHAQLRRPQGKLVRVIEGAIFDVAVDIRRSSPTFGRWLGLELDAATAKQIYVPPGFAHGFCVISEVAQVEYKCTDFYCPGDELNLLWNDPELGIEWPVNDPILSAKDASAQPLHRILHLLPVFEEAA